MRVCVSTYVVLLSDGVCTTLNQLYGKLHFANGNRPNVKYVSRASYQTLTDQPAPSARLWTETERWESGQTKTTRERALVGEYGLMWRTGGKWKRKWPFLCSSIAPDLSWMHLYTHHIPPVLRTQAVTVCHAQVGAFRIFFRQDFLEKNIRIFILHNIQYFKNKTFQKGPNN